MKLNIKFEEGQSHAWLAADEKAPELFFKLPFTAACICNGELCVKLTAEMVEEAYNSRPSDTEPCALFVLMGKKLYFVKERVTFAGGDSLLFISKLAHFH